jgi:hypothetical protein
MPAAIPFAKKLSEAKSRPAKEEPKGWKISASPLERGAAV